MKVALLLDSVSKPSPLFIFRARVAIILTLTTFLVYHTRDDFGHAWMVLIYLPSGFMVGTYTCNLRSNQSGFLVTLAIFITLNFIHSLLDGISLTNLDEVVGKTSMFSHELLRQPTLYAMAWVMFRPFRVSRTHKILASFAAVTLVWLVGIISGKASGQWLQHLGNFHDYIAPSIFLFIGDMAHHLYDEKKKLDLSKAIHLG